MTTGLIIAIIVVAAVFIGALVLVPRLGRRRRERALERELQERRTQAAQSHHDQAERRAERADMAERRARIAEQEAQRERAEARLHEERAAIHEQGLADDQLMPESDDADRGRERERRPRRQERVS